MAAVERSPEGLPRRDAEIKALPVERRASPDLASCPERLVHVARRFDGHEGRAERGACVVLFDDQSVIEVEDDSFHPCVPSAELHSALVGAVSCARQEAQSDLLRVDQRRRRESELATRNAWT